MTLPAPPDLPEVSPDRIPAAGLLPLIALVGLPGVGKSTIGRRLSVALDCAFVDTDDWIEARTGRTIPIIFEQLGEARFRELEAEALSQIEHLHPKVVVATGGGIVTSAASREFLSRRAFTVYLHAPRPTLLSRVTKNKKRPLFRSGDVAGVLARMDEERSPIYRAIAKLICDLEGRTLNDTVAYLAAALNTVDSVNGDRSEEGLR